MFHLDNQTYKERVLKLIKYLISMLGVPSSDAHFFCFSAQIHTQKFGHVRGFIILILIFIISLQTGSDCNPIFV